MTSGKQVEGAEDFAKNALDDSNVGYQMLQQQGWEEGQGLGAKGSGATAPVNMAQGAGEGTGVGVAATHEVDKMDDDVEQYRKRMMLAYRFRPNPLNNPRRAYY